MQPELWCHEHKKWQRSKTKTWGTHRGTMDKRKWGSSLSFFFLRGGGEKSLQEDPLSKEKKFFVPVPLFSRLLFLLFSLSFANFQTNERPTNRDRAESPVTFIQREKNNLKTNAWSEITLHTFFASINVSLAVIVICLIPLQLSGYATWHVTPAVCIITHTLWFLSLSIERKKNRSATEVARFFFSLPIIHGKKKKKLRKLSCKSRRRNCSVRTFEGLFPKEAKTKKQAWEEATIYVCVHEKNLYETSFFFCSQFWVSNSSPNMSASERGSLQSFFLAWPLLRKV